jgi:2-oxo-3-hexenedioate decarboxylase
MEVFRAPHGRGVRSARALLIGPRNSIAARARDWGRTLSTFEIDLKRDGTVVDYGRATNVLGYLYWHCVISSIFSRAIRSIPPLAADEIVTTGTLTRALPGISRRDMDDRTHGCRA